MNSSPLCKHLRAKSMFIPALAAKQPEPPEEPAASHSHCWCNCTLTETGPDDKPVGHQRCQPSRGCFEE